MSKSLLTQLQAQSGALYRKQINETKQLVNKWTRLGLLEGLSKNQDRLNMALMLENEAKHLLREFTKTGGVGSEEWSSIALPLVRRIFSELAAKNFVSIQPMTMSSGLVFYLDFKYGTDKAGFNTARGASGQAASIFGITNQPGKPTEGLYGSGRFGYSINNYETTASFVTGSVTAADVNFDADLTATSGSLKKVTVNLSGHNHDTLGVSAFAISGGGVGAYYPAFTKALDESGNISTSKVTFVVAVSGSFTSTVDIKFQKQPNLSARGDFEAQGDPSWGNGSSTEFGAASEVGNNYLNIPQLDIDITQKAIQAKTRKLKAVWTPEMAQDLDAYHSIDAEAEVTSVMSEYITMEVDLEILEMLYTSALTKEVWSAQVGKVWNGTAFVSQDVNEGRSLAYTQPTWFQTLGTKMQSVSNQIHKKIIRGGANFAVVSPEVATIIESIPGFNTDGNGTEMGVESFAMGVQRVGSINKRFDIYKNPYWEDNSILMGYRGNQFLETGAAFCPYVPLIMSPTIVDPDNFTPRKSLMMRYAKTMLRPEYYGIIHVADLNHV